MHKVLYLINDVLAKVNHCLGCAKISDFEILSIMTGGLPNKWRMS